MDSIVTARVPVGIKEQGKKALQKIGATPTDLVNAAYRYVLEEGKLPQSSRKSIPDAKSSRKLTAAQRKKIAARLNEVTFSIPASYWDGKTDDELLAEALKEKYEGLD